MRSGTVATENQYDSIIDGFFFWFDNPKSDKGEMSSLKLRDYLENMIVQNWAESPNPMGAACKLRVEDHQKMVEFEEGYDIFSPEKSIRPIIDSLYEFQKNIEVRAFSKKRTPNFVHRMIQIRNNVVNNLMSFGVRLFRENRLANGQPIQEVLSELVLTNKQPILQQTLVNNLLLMRTERLFGVPPTFSLDLVPYTDETFDKMVLRSLLCLYKENLSAGNTANADAIIAYIRETNTRKGDQKSQFHVIRSKIALQQNRLEDAWLAVKEAMQCSPINPKINDCLSEILFRSFLDDESLFNVANEQLIRDFFDALHRMLLSNYHKYENKIFSVILVLFSLYSSKLVEINKVLASFFGRLSPNFLRSHFYEIALCFSDDVLKIIYEKLCGSQLLEFSYIFDTFTFGVNSEADPTTEFYVSADGNQQVEVPRGIRAKERIKHQDMFNKAISILKNYLPRQTCMLDTLANAANELTVELDLDIMILIRALIDECYDTGKVNRQLLLRLCNRDNSLYQPIELLRNESLEPNERLYKLIKLLEKALFERQSVIGESRLARKLLEVNTIFFISGSKSLLYIDGSNQLEEYRVSPYIKSVEHNDTFALQLDIFSRDSKKRKLLMIPKTSQNLIDNLLFEQLNFKASELFVSDPHTFEIYKGRTQGMLFASKAWILSVRFSNQKQERSDDRRSQHVFH